MTVRFYQRVAGIVCVLSLLLGQGVCLVRAADDIISTQELLERVRQGRVQDAQDNRRREAAFLAEKAAQEQKLVAAEKRVAELERESLELEARFSRNERLIEEKRQQRNERLGSLKELFGHLTAAVGNMRSQFRNSISTSQFVDREAFLSALIHKMGSDTELPSLQEIERVWFEQHREMTESGRIVRYRARVGTTSGRELVRVGLFNLVSNGEYLAYDPDTRGVSVLPRQPARFLDGARRLQAATGDMITPLGIDPTGGSGGGLLRAIIDTPTLKERWHQGGQIGYIITAIGLFALLLGGLRFLLLGLTALRMSMQMRSQKIGSGNPLGRVLLVAERNAGMELENLQLKLDEAILRETPQIQRGLSLLKIIAMVAPLLGLLGTVTGMIIVFQAITIYGAGDPRAMAGGISSALVTTVLGLAVAIPTLLLHTLLSARARKILHILEEQSAGIIAERAGH